MLSPSRFLSPAMVAALLTSAGTSLAATDTFVYETVAGWTVHTDRARNFTCFMEARYEGSSVLRVGFEEASGSMRLIFGDPAWSSIEPGESYSVQLGFGDEVPWTGTATGVPLAGADDAYLRFDIADRETDAFMRQLMKEFSVAVSYEGREAISLSLDGSYGAALKLRECQDVMAGMSQPHAESRSAEEAS